MEENYYSFTDKEGNTQYYCKGLNSLPFAMRDMNRRLNRLESLIEEFIGGCLDAEE